MGKSWVLLLLSVLPLHAATLLLEGFDDVSALGGTGWVIFNSSSPLGSTSWFQGNALIFPAQSGPADSYVAANFLAAGAGGNVDLWLVTPQVTSTVIALLKFQTRTTTSPATAPDRLQILYNPNGSSLSQAEFIQVGAINQALDVLGYPADWTPFEVAAQGSNSGRFAFRYAVPNTNVNGDYIGIDSVEIVDIDVPEPSTFITASAMLFFMLPRFRRRTLRRVATGLFAVGTPLLAQQAQADSEAWKNVKVRVVNRPDLQGKITAITGRIAHIEGGNSPNPGAGRGVERSADAVVMPLPKGGQMAILGASHLTMLRAEKTTEGKVKMTRTKPAPREVKDAR